MTVALTCRWVPGTLDRVSVRTAHGEVEVSLFRVKQALGRDALEGLYLRDCFALPAEDPRALPALEALLGINSLLSSAAD